MAASDVDGVSTLCVSDIHRDAGGGSNRSL